MQRTPWPSVLGGALALVLVSWGCSRQEKTGCLASSSPTCRPPPPCERLSYECTGGSVSVFQVTEAAQRPAGLRAVASRGDYVLQNEHVVAVIDAIENPHQVSPSGGTLVDLAAREGTDHLNQVYQLTGILPRDAAHYESLEVLQSAESAAIIARGHLDGDHRVSIVTRYELRPCDRGIRIRSEVYNGGRTVWTHLLADGYFWGNGGLTPFVPALGQGFRHPRLDLLHPEQGYREFPWMAAQSHAAPHASYSTLSCTREKLLGLNDPTISAVGLPPTLVQPGDGLVFERMIFTSAGAGLGGAQALALEAHARLFGGKTAEVRGRVVSAQGNAVGGDERLVSLLIYEPARGDSPDDPERILPWTEVVPGADGRFVASLPAGRAYRVRPYRLGRPVGEALPLELASAEGSAPVELGELRISLPGRLTVHVSNLEGRPLDAEVVLVPTGRTTRDAVAGSVYGLFRDEDCRPYLGPPGGGSPACNRALVQGGSVTLDVPPGDYWVYGTAGPEHTLARAALSVVEGSTHELSFSLRYLEGMMPLGALSADFHVHSGRSFDTVLPERDRALSFLASGVQVIAATDHEVSNDFSEALAELGVGGRVAVMPGVETTCSIPFLLMPGSTVPRCTGHFNFWPLPYDPAAYNNGAPWDELVEPGQLYERMRPLIGPRGVIQINHPTSGGTIGRDGGYLRVVQVNPRQPLPSRDDGTATGMLFARPGGKPDSPRNIDFDAQEVMTGSPLVRNLQYRQVWHSFLNQGLLRAGTANSDSHAMSGDILGYPRNLVLGDFALERFEPGAFNDAVRAGRLIGTNGPFLEVSLRDAEGRVRGPALEAFRPGAAATLDVVVRAAPWIPVEEIRFVVNGEVRKRFTVPEEARPPDPFGSAGVLRWSGSVSVAELLGGRDGWISVEAGLPLPRALDEDSQGKTDGLVDRMDFGDGTLTDVVAIPSESEARFHHHVIAPRTWSYAFTNPFLLDLEGNGWTPPGL